MCMRPISSYVTSNLTAFAQHKPKMKQPGIILWCIVLFYNISLAFFAPLENADNLASGEYGGVTGKKLLALSKQHPKYNVISNKVNSISWPSPNGLECYACKFIVGVMQDLFRKKKSDEFIAKTVIYLCKKFGIEDTLVCTGVVHEFQNEVLTVFDEVALSPQEVCGLILGPSCGKVKDLYPDWDITLPKVPKPPVHPIPLPKVSKYTLFFFISFAQCRTCPSSSTTLRCLEWILLIV